MDNNNTESDSKRLGGIFLILGWIAVIALIALLLNHSLFSTREPSISDTDAGKQITIYRDRDSHFRIKGSINGIPVTFLIDTGATSVAVAAEVAKRANLSKEASLTTETAAGNSIGYFTMIDKLTIGGIDIKNISAVIVPDMGDNEALLGMNVLQKFNIKQTNDVMILSVPPPTDATH